MDDNETQKVTTLPEGTIVIYPVIVKRKLSSSNPDDPDYDVNGELSGETTTYEVMSGEVTTTTTALQPNISRGRPRKSFKAAHIPDPEEWKPKTKEQIAAAVFDHQFDKEEAEKEIHTEKLDCLVCGESINAEAFEDHTVKEHQGKGALECPYCNFSSGRQYSTK